MGGMVKWAYVDVSFFVIFPFFVLLSVFTLMWAIATIHSMWFLLSAPLSAAILLPTVIFPFTRINNEKAMNIVLFIIAVIGFDFIISLGIAERFENWTLWHLLWAFCWMVGICVALAGYFCFFSSETSSGKVVIEFLKAVKNRVCPFVEPPQTWKDKGKEKQLNVGDG
jgi:hypothetical protein